MDSIAQFIKQYKYVPQVICPPSRKDLLWKLAQKLRDEAWADGFKIPYGLEGFKKTATLAKKISDHRLLQLVNMNERISWLFYNDRKNAPKSPKKPKQATIF